MYHSLLLLQTLLLSDPAQLQQSEMWIMLEFEHAAQDIRCAAGVHSGCAACTLLLDHTADAGGLYILPDAICAWYGMASKHVLYFAVCSTSLDWLCVLTVNPLSAASLAEGSFDKDGTCSSWGCTEVAGTPCPTNELA